MKMHGSTPQRQSGLYEIPRHRLERTRHTAANRATVALLDGHARAARLWCQVVTDCDAELNRVDRSEAA